MLLSVEGERECGGNRGGCAVGESRQAQAEHADPNRGGDDGNERDTCGNGSQNGCADHGKAASHRIEYGTREDSSQTVANGERIAQFIITPVLTPSYEVAEELSDTERSAGGFGSTGK